MKLSAAASRLPSSPSSRDPPDDTIGIMSGASPSVTNLSLDFWRSMFRNDESMAKRYLRQIQEHRGGDVFSFDELSELSAPLAEGKYSPKIALLPGTLKSIVDHWNSPKLTGLVRIDPEVHCLSLVGDASKQNELYFVGCAQFIQGTGGPEECGFGTHADESRTRALSASTGAAYAVKIINASKATKAKILSHVILLEANVPSLALANGFADLLTGLEAPAFVWKIVLEAYPGLEEAGRICLGGGEVSESIEPEGGQGDWGIGGDREAEEFLLRPVAVDHISQVKSGGPLSELRESGVVNLEGDDNTIQALDHLMERAFTGAASQVRDPTSHASPASRFPWERDPPESWSESSSLGLQSWPGAHANQSWRPAFNRLRGEFGAFKSKLSKSLEARDISLARQFRGLYEQVRDLRLNLISRVEALEGWQQCEEAGTAGSGDAVRRVIESHAKRSCSPLVIPPPTPQELTIGWGDLSEEQQQAFVNSAAIKSFGWDNMTVEERKKLFHGIIDHMDVSELATLVGQHLKIDAIRNSLSHLEARIAGVETDLNDPEGSVGSLQRKLEEWEARRDSSASSRGGYTFRDQEDVEALVATVPDPEFYRYFLDIFSFLSIAPNSFSTYAEGINRNQGISVLARPLSTTLKTHSYVELRRNSVIAPCHHTLTMGSASALCQGLQWIYQSYPLVRIPPMGLGRGLGGWVWRS